MSGMSGGERGSGVKKGVMKRGMCRRGGDTEGVILRM